VAKLNVEFARVLNAQDIRERLAAQGTEVRTDSPESFGAFIRNETARWAKVVKESGAKFE
jgi:tripartite-type tricarboxylate transporter receptor subunit TctC